MDVNYLKKIGYYYNDLDKIAERKIWEHITVRGVNLSSKTISQAYKEMKEIKFRGDIIDYLCYICLIFMIEMLIETGEIIRNSPNIGTTIESHFEVLMWVRPNVQSAVCRLILKDETYLEDAFGVLSPVAHKDELFIIAKKVIINEINSFMKIESDKHNNVDKLKRN